MYRARTTKSDVISIETVRHFANGVSSVLEVASCVEVRVRVRERMFKRMYDICAYHEHVQ